MERIFMYVTHSRRAAFEALGWKFSAHLGRTHGMYSALYEWVGEGPPQFPTEDCVNGRSQVKTNP